MHSEQDAWLVFGLSGPVAAPLREGWRVGDAPIIAVSRRERGSEGCIAWREGSLQSPPALPSRVRGVISLGPLDAFSAWFAASTMECGRVIAIGSMSEVFKRDSPIAAERVLAETLRTSRARLRAACAERGVPCLVLRPTLVLGGGSGPPDGLSRLCALAARWRIAPVPWPAPGLRQPLHRADLAEAVCLAMQGTPIDADVDLGGPQVLRLDALLRQVYANRCPGALRLPMPLPRLFAPWLPPAWRAALARAGQDQRAPDSARGIPGWAPTRPPG